MLQGWVRSDSIASLVRVNLPPDALPAPIVVALVIAVFVVAAMAIRQALKFKEYSRDFPSQKATVVVCLVLLSYLVAIAGLRMALGLKYPDGYDAIHFLVGSGLGFGAMWGVGKHAFSAEREAAKSTQVQVRADEAVVNTEAPAATPAQIPTYVARPTQFAGDVEPRG